MSGLHACGKKFCEFINIMRAKDDIHEPVALLQLFHDLRFLHHTAAQRDHHVRILLFDPPELSQTSVDSLICIFTHCTCVIDDKIRFLLFRLLRVSDSLEDTGKLFRISGIHLASERGNAERKTPASRPAHLLQIFFCSFHKIILPLRFLYRDQRFLFGSICHILIHFISCV